ncbi:MAG: endonuclease/exonuclease/phosphatase family protein [Hamadaea sp.]|nr:endonuclease/exonuclease/phosphatase family protein [Hamadaea sp.]
MIAKWGRRLLVAVQWLFAAGVTGWAIARLAGLDRWFPAAQLISFTPYVTVVALLGTALLGAARRWRALAVAGTATLVLVACVAPRVLPDTGSGGDGPVLRVASVNVFIGGTDPAAIVATAREQRVDLLAVQEMTPQWLAAADEAGIGEMFPQRFTAAEYGAGGSALFSRFPLADAGSYLNAQGWFQQAYGTLTVPGAAPVRLESVHAASPYSAEMTPDWRETLRKAPPATPDGTVRVLLGDFNATLDHSLLRKLIGTGYRDAAETTGKGLVGTWGPYDGKPVPPVAIDHVLADERIGVRSFDAFTIDGGDHRLIVAELALPPA